MNRIFSKAGEMEEQNTDVLGFGDAIGRLALAPLPGVVLITGPMLVAAIWGTLSAWSAAAALFGVREFPGWAPMRGFGMAGCACGLFYAYLAYLPCPRLRR